MNRRAGADVRTLDRETLVHATREVCAQDADLAAVVSVHGVPPLWPRTSGFAALVKLILEQQVSLASARACYNRLVAKVGRVTPRAVEGLTLAQIRACGFTRQKAGYTRELARLVTSGDLSLRALKHKSDDEVRRLLLAVRGLGPWTVDVFLLLSLRRPDVWPDGDVALSESMRTVKRMTTRPDNERMRRVAARWKPWRSVGARILWHDYLNRRR